MCVEVGNNNARLDEPFCCDNGPRCQGSRCCRETRCRVDRDRGCYCDPRNIRDCAVVPQLCRPDDDGDDSCQECREGERDCLCVEIGDGNVRLREPYCCDNGQRCQGSQCCRDTRCRYSVDHIRSLHSFAVHYNWSSSTTHTRMGRLGDRDCYCDRRDDRLCALVPRRCAVYEDCQVHTRVVLDMLHHGGGGAHAHQVNKAQLINRRNPLPQLCRSGSRDCLCLNSGLTDGDVALSFCCDNGNRCEGQKCCRRCRKGDRGCKCSGTDREEFDRHF